eukprot:1185365-Prorocentrum_minimum.AAC.4
MPKSLKHVYYDKATFVMLLLRVLLPCRPLPRPPPARRSGPPRKPRPQECLRGSMTTRRARRMRRMPPSGWKPRTHNNYCAHSRSRSCRGHGHSPRIVAAPVAVDTSVITRQKTMFQSL